MKRNHTIREEDICRFSRHLHDLEYAPGSIEKYLRDLTAFQHWLAGRTVTQREIAAWKEYLHSLGCRSETVNTKLSALNRFFAFQGWSGLRARYYRIQRRFFRSTEREMTREDYGRLLSTAEGMGKTRLALLMETICATGIRVSEVRYLTVEAAWAGGPAGRPGGDLPQGEGPHHPHPRQAVPQAGAVRKEAEHRHRRDFPHPEGERTFPPADLGGDESPLRPGRSGRQQGLPPQSAPSVCPHLLPCQPGRGPAGRRAGPFQHRDHPDLSALHRSQPHPAAGTAGADFIAGFITKYKLRPLPGEIRAGDV